MIPPNTPIIPESILSTVDPTLIDHIQNEQNQFQSTSEDEVYGYAFRRYLLFSYFPHILSSRGINLSNLDIFYNRYYWFSKFVNLARSEHGPDDGNDQLLFQIMESAPEGVDWDVVERIASET